VTGGVENSLWFVGQGGHFLKVNLIIENNLIDAWLYEKEAYEMKCGQYIIRHNTFINQGDVSGHRLRSDSGIMFYGNWSEDNFNGDIAAATYNTAICFNFVKNIEDAVGIRMFPFHCEESSGYGNQDNRLMKHNVSSGAGRCLLASEAKTTVPIGYQSDSVMEGNHFYSAHIANSDADGAGNYDRASDQGLGQNLTETQWRAANTWGTNTYTNQFLVPTMNAVDPDLFDGPGDDITVDDVYQIYGFDLFGSLYGQPSQIKMPSWWKLSTVLTWVEPDYRVDGSTLVAIDTYTIEYGGVDTVTDPGILASEVIPGNVFSFNMPTPEIGKTYRARILATDKNGKTSQLSGFAYVTL
jgi:hypothetical protein